MTCPCGGASYETCCGPRHSGSSPADTAEALMRSRYCAYALGRFDYLGATQRSERRGAETHVKWVGLTVHNAKGGQGDFVGEVEFTARYLSGHSLFSLHERSAFERVDGRWIYTTGNPDQAETKVERNAPCPCDSGKKFKSCCA